MTFRILAGLSFLWLLPACGTTTGPQGASTGEEKEIQDQAWQQLSDWYALTERQLPTLILTIDTLERLAQEAAVEANNYHPRAMEAVADLKHTLKQFSAWMAITRTHKLEDLQKRYDHAGVLTFIDKEFSSIEVLNKALDENLAKARQLIEERKPEGF